MVWGNSKTHLISLLGFYSEAQIIGCVGVLLKKEISFSTLSVSILNYCNNNISLTNIILSIVNTIAYSLNCILFRRLY